MIQHFLQARACRTMTLKHIANQSDEPCPADVRTAGVDGAERIAEGREVKDLLPVSFALDKSESEWFATILTAAELRFIFGDEAGGKNED